MQNMPEIKKRKVNMAASVNPDKIFGTRAIVRVQLSRGFDDADTQKRLEFLHSRGYNLVQVVNEKVMTEYFGIDDPGQARDFLGGNNGVMFPTLYFQRAFTTKKTEK